MLEKQKNIPKKILGIPPPAILLILNNATIEDMKKITGILPLGVKAQCINTEEAMTLLFKESKLLKNYPKKWQCKSLYIGGLWSAYHFCASADLVIAVKMKNVWDRDMKILEEIEKCMNNFKKDFIVAHLLGLDFCKDNNLKTEGAILIFKKIIKTILKTDFNLILTSDHSGEENIPYFEVFTHIN
ncbi:MAG: hypothetical protein KGD63_11180 [Candidatus Lokiarchaeota archaeon]|nr:hypothetical protein [Candidatus Lokiarchaeota archaeon]